jgi:hypothetical protein
MSGFFRNIDPPPPQRPASVYPPPPLVRGRTHSLGGEGVGGQYSEDARHCSVLYICKYFVVMSYVCEAREEAGRTEKVVKYGVQQIMWALLRKNGKLN